MSRKTCSSYRRVSELVKKLVKVNVLVCTGLNTVENDFAAKVTNQMETRFKSCVIPQYSRKLLTPVIKMIAKIQDFGRVDASDDNGSEAWVFLLRSDQFSYVLVLFAYVHTVSGLNTSKYAHWERSEPSWWGVYDLQRGGSTTRFQKSSESVVSGLWSQGNEPLAF